MLFFSISRPPNPLPLPKLLQPSSPSSPRPLQLFSLHLLPTRSPPPPPSSSSPALQLFSTQPQPIAAATTIVIFIFYALQLLPPKKMMLETGGEMDITLEICRIQGETKSILKKLSWKIEYFEKVRKDGWRKRWPEWVATGRWLRLVFVWLLANFWNFNT